MENKLNTQKDDSIKLLGTVRFINEDNRNRDKFTVTIAVTPDSKMEAERIGIPVKHNEHDGKQYELIHFNMYANSRIADLDGEHTWTDMPLKYGDKVVAKVAPRSYDYMGKKGTACRLLGMFVLEYSRRGGFTKEELEQLRNDMDVPF